MLHSASFDIVSALSDKLQLDRKGFKPSESVCLTWEWLFEGFVSADISAGFDTDSASASLLSMGRRGERLCKSQVWLFVRAGADNVWSPKPRNDGSILTRLFQLSKIYLKESIIIKRRENPRRFCLRLLWCHFLPWVQHWSCAPRFRTCGVKHDLI